MGQVRWSTVCLRAFLIVALGSGAGIADSMRRPITLSRAAPEPVPVVPQTSAPAQGPATPSTAKPGEPGWHPTPKSALPAGQITIDEAKAFFDQGAAFVDTRKSDEYQAGHIKDAFRISLSNFKTGDPALLGMIPRDSVVICYCNGGQCDESEAVARMFSNSGYTKVYVLHDGFPGWKAMNLPINTGPGIEAE